MYQPSHFQESDQTALCKLIRERPLASLMTTSAQGLFADHVPLVISTDNTGKMRLRGHIARANPLFAQLQAALPAPSLAASPAGSTGSLPALAIFHGAQGYISPDWYPAKRVHGRVVPTWNYVAVHARGRLRLVEDPAWLPQQLQALTDQQEAASADPWAVDDAPEDFILRLGKAIVGIELAVDNLTGQWKLSQNKDSATREGIIAGLQQRGEHEDQALAKLMAALAGE